MLMNGNIANLDEYFALKCSGRFMERNLNNNCKDSLQTRLVFLRNILADFTVYYFAS